MLRGARSHVSVRCCGQGGGARRGPECQTPVGAARCVCQTLGGGSGWLGPAKCPLSQEKGFLSFRAAEEELSKGQDRGRGLRAAGGGGGGNPLSSSLWGLRVVDTQESQIKAGAPLVPIGPQPGSSLLPSSPGTPVGLKAGQGLKASHRVEGVPKQFEWIGRVRRGLLTLVK